MDFKYIRPKIKNIAIRIKYEKKDKNKRQKTMLS